MAEHALKLDARWFEAVASGQKTVELRREDDRRFAVGDVLILREYHAAFPVYIAGMNQDPLQVYEPRLTDRTCRVRVTHILHSDAPDLVPPGVAALSIRRLVRKES